MTSSPKFSIIIPTFNRLELLKETISSIGTQAFKSFEIIVVDDGSTDGGPDWLAGNAPDIRVLIQDHRGPGAARNAGARIASGAYLAFLDSDDLWFPWTLQTYATIIEQQNQPAFMAGRPHLFSTGDRLDDVTQSNPQALAFKDYLASSDEWRWWGASSFVIRRDAFLRAGGFCERNVYAEDADLALKLGVEPTFVQITAPATFAYRQHAHNSMSNLERIAGGAQLLTQSEREGIYPGGQSRLGERLEIITRHIRPTVLACLKSKRWKDAAALYRHTFAWNLRLGRIRYLASFFAFALLAGLRRGL